MARLKVVVTLLVFCAGVWGAVWLSRALFGDLDFYLHASPELVTVSQV